MTAEGLITLDAEPLRAPGGRPRTAALGAGAIAGAAAMSIAVLSFLQTAHSAAGAKPVIAAGVIAAAAMVSVGIRFVRGTAAAGERLHIALSREGVTLATPVQATTVQWSAVQVEERRNEFLFYFTENRIVRVRKDAITEEQGVERLRSFLIGQVGTRAKLRS